MALSGQGELISRVGHDKDYGTARQAQKMGAVDRVDINLHNSVDNAEIVLLAIPMDQIRPTLEAIAPDLKDGSVVMDTAPLKEVVVGWANELLPEGRHYIGLTPVINPAYLLSPTAGLNAARADLFDNGLMAIVAPPRSISEAIKLAVDLTHLIKATPMFFDAVEIDSLMTATHLLPQLMSVALVNATIDRPGWMEGRKIAGRAYAEAANPIRHVDTLKGLASALALSRENSLRMIDWLVAALNSARSEIDQGQIAALEARLEHANASVELWWKQRSEANWAAEEVSLREPLPTSSDMLGRWVGLKRKPKK
jgi:prephenate dehydrogenase